MAFISTTTHLLSTGETLTLRPGTPADARAMIHILEVVVAEGLYTLVSTEELNTSIEAERARIEKSNAHPSFLTVVAEVKNQIVGTLEFSCGHRKRIEHTGDFAIIVLKSHRELGIGSLLMNTLVEWAKAHPLLEKISLKVHSNNPRAIHVYDKFGFKEEGRLKKDLKYNDTLYVDTVIMARPV